MKPLDQILSNIVDFLVSLGYDEEQIFNILLSGINIKQSRSQWKKKILTAINRDKENFVNPDQTNLFD